MATALTLAQMRDQVRRNLEIVPPIDFTTPGSAGALPSGQPDPNNATINNALNEGIWAVNRVVRIGALQDLSISVSAAGATKRGAYYVDVSSILPTILSADEIEDVWWNDGANTARLAPYTYNAAQKDAQQFQQLAPGRPMQYLLSGSQIGLVAPPLASGTLYLTVASAIPPLVSDTDQIAFLPVEYQVVVLYWATAILSARRATDVESQERMKSFLGFAQQGTLQIYAWKNGYKSEGIESVRDMLMMIPAVESAARNTPNTPGPPMQQANPPGS